MRKGKIKKKKKVVKAELSDSRGFEIFASRGNEGNREEERRGRGCFCRVAQGMPHEEQGDPAASRACHGRAALARVCPKHAWPRLWLGLESISWGDRARQHPHPSSAPRCPAWRLCRGYPQAVIPAQGNFSTVRAAEIFRAHKDGGEGVFSPCSAWHGGVREN